jgi:transposase-like protein
MPPRARSGTAGVEEFAELVAARIVAMGHGGDFRLTPSHLSTKQLADRLGIPEETLRDWRKKNRGPAYIRSESDGDKATILYPLAEVEAWEKRRLITPAST